MENTAEVITKDQEIQRLRWQLAGRESNIRKLQRKLDVADCTPELIRARKALLHIEQLARGDKLTPAAVMKATAEGMGDDGPKRSQRA